MAGTRDSFVFFQVRSESADSAFSFYSGIAKNNSYIWFRSEKEIKEFAENGELLGACHPVSGKLVALCYVTFIEQSNEYEIGGVVVSAEVQHLGLAAVLVRFALAHVIANERPWKHHREIIAHVQEANGDPRNLMARLGFKHVRRFTLEGDEVP